MEIIEIAKTLGEKLAQSEEYKNFCETRDKCRANKILKAKLDEFKVQKSILDIESEKPDSEKDENLIDVINARVETLYSEITNDPEMKAYNKAEDDLNILMTAINMTITSYINPQDIATPGDAAYGDDEEGGCTHYCSTCKGCHPAS